MTREEAFEYLCNLGMSEKKAKYVIKAFNEIGFILWQEKKEFDDPQKFKKWIDHGDECECPFCHETWNYCDNDTETFKFCPNCGQRC